MEEYVLGIDMGTSGVKAGLLNLVTLQLECVTVRSYPNEAEQDPEILWGKTVEVVREALDQLGGRGNVKAIGLSGQMHGAVLYDANGQLVGPLINWKDCQWSNPSVLEKMKLLMGDRSYDELGTEIASGYSAAILFGIKEKDPGLFNRIARFVLPVDFLRGRLLGLPSYATDPTNAFSTGLFNTKTNCWHEELIQKLRLPFSIFPEVHPTSQIAGEVSDQVADRVGLTRHVPVVYGGGDNQLSMLGSGLAGANSPTLINIGTAAQISKVAVKFHKYPGMDTRSYFDGAFAVVGASLAGGGSYSWLRDKIWEEGTSIEYYQMDELAAAVPPGADGLVYCSGPSRQEPTRAKGFGGNTARIKNIAYRARAVLEGVLMDLYAPYELLGGQQGKFIVGAGKGLQKSQVWSHIAADLFGSRLCMTGFENAVFGAALMASQHVRDSGTLAETVRSIKYATEIIPDESNLKFYRDEFIGYWRAAVRTA
jgi:sugar (pentulose or hexulose) kinase